MIERLSSLQHETESLKVLRGTQLPKILFCILFFVLFFPLSSFVKAQNNTIIDQPSSKVKTKSVKLSLEEQTWLKDHTDITFAYPDTFEPELIVNPDGTYRGSFVDILNIVNERLGTNIQLTAKPISDIIYKVSSMELSGILGIDPVYAKKLGWLTTKTFAKSYPAVYSRKSFTFTAPTDLADKTIAVIDELFFSQNLENLYGEGSTLIKVENAVEGLERVRDGSADLFIGSSTNSYLLGKYQFFDLNTVFQFYDHPIPVTMGVRSDWPLLVSILNKGLASISVEEVEAISRKWIGPPEENNTVTLTESERNWITKHQMIRFGFMAGYDPYLMVDNTGRQSGVLVDLGDELRRELGVDIQISAFRTIPDLLEASEAQTIDVVYCIQPQRAKKRGLLSTEVFLRSYVAIYTRVGEKVISPEDMIGKSVSIAKDATFIKRFLQPHIENITVVPVDTPVDGLRMVSDGLVDMYVGSTTQKALTDKYRIGGVSQAYIHTNEGRPFVMGVRPDKPEIVSILNKGLSRIGHHGIEKIVAKWLHPVKRKETIKLSPEETSWLAAHPHIRLGYVDTFEPEVIANPDGSYSGMLIDFLEELNRRLGTQIGLEIDTVPGILEQAKTKKVDGILEMLPEYADKLGLLKTATYLSAYPSIFGRHDISYNDASDCIGKKVAINNKVLFSEKIAQEHCGQATIVKVNNSLEGLRLVSQGDVDFFIGAGFNSYLITKYQLFDIASKHIFFDLKSRFGMAIRPDWPELVTILNKAITSFTENEVDAIVAKWVHTPPQKEIIVPTPKERSWLAEKNTVRIRITDWPPYIIIKENEPPRGLTIEYLDLVSKRTGINFEYEVTRQPFSEFLEGMKRGQSPDMTPLIIRTPEREQYLSFTSPYISSPYVILSRESENIVFDISGLEGKTVAVPKGFIIQQLLERDYPDIKLLLFKSDEEALLAVSTGQAEGYIGNLLVATHIIQKRGLSNLRVVASTPFGDQALSMGNRNDWPELTSIIDKVLTNITEEETTAIRNKYISLRYNQGIDRAKVLKWLLIFIAVSTTILLLILFWNRQLALKVKKRTNALEKEMAGHLQTNARLAESEARFRATFEQAAVGIAHVSADGNFLRINKRLCEIMGYGQEEMLQLTFRDITPAEDLDADIQQLNRLVTREIDTLTKEKTYLRKDGTLFWALVTVSLVQDEQGQPQWFMAVVSDISQRKEAQIALENMREYTDHLIESANVIIIGLDTKGNVTHFNPAAENITGYSRSELIGKNWFNTLVPKKRFPEVHSEFDRLIKGGLPKSFENPIQTKDGQERFISWTNSEISRDGDIVGITSFGMDITERKQAETALLESEEKFRTLIEQAPFSVQILNLQGKITVINAAFMKLWGFSDDSIAEVLEKYNILEDEEAKALGVMPYIEKAFRGEIVTLPIIEYDAEATMEALNLDAPANKRWIQSRLYPVKNTNGEVISIVDIEEDMTEQKLAEDNVQSYQKRLRALARQLTIAEEGERRRLAAELHDHVGQSLVFSRIQLSELKEDVDDEPLKYSIDQVSQSLLGIIKDTKNLVFDLSSPLLHEVGLSAATSQWLTENVNKKYGIETECTDHTDFAIVSPELKALLFRNIRELLTNIIKHSFANKVRVIFDRKDDNLIITVEDNGIGFETNKPSDSVSNTPGFGLFSIQERIDDLGGSFEISSVHGKGCTTIMKIPLTE